MIPRRISWHIHATVTFAQIPSLSSTSSINRAIIRDSKWSHYGHVSSIVRKKVKENSSSNGSIVWFTRCWKNIFLELSLAAFHVENCWLPTLRNEKHVLAFWLQNSNLCSCGNFFRRTDSHAKQRRNQRECPIHTREFGW